MGRTHTKTVVVVEVVDVVVVAVGAAGVRFIIVERAAPHHAAFDRSAPSSKMTKLLYNQFFILYRTRKP